MRLRAAVALAVLVAAAAVVGVVLVATHRNDEPSPVLVDEKVGVLHGVHFGDGVRDVRRRLGPEADDRDGFFPAGATYTGPPSISVPQANRRPRVRPIELHYDDYAYLVSPSAGVFAMATLERGARTRAGVGVADDLERVRERYVDNECGRASATESAAYPWCRADVGDIRVFFGGDPIGSITLTRRPGR